MFEGFGMGVGEWGTARDETRGMGGEGGSVNVRGGGAIGWLGCWVRLDETVKHHS